MRPSLLVSGVLVTGLAVVGLTSRTNATHPHGDFGSFVADVLADHSEQLFGIGHPLEQSALGPYDGPDNLEAIQVAHGLHVSLVSSSVASAADQIALWPDDDNPKYLFVCDEETSDPAVQRVDLSKPAAATRRPSSRASSPATRCGGRPGAPSSSLRKREQRAASMSSSTR
jgi:hypothetical protein